MKLHDYLSENSIKVEAFAARVRLSADSIYKYLRGERTPNGHTISKIITATNGEVTANDFYDLPPPKKRNGKHTNGAT